jgi:hypothetical protein
LVRRVERTGKAKSVKLNAMRIAGWIVFVVGLALVVYGKYFFQPPYGGSGIIVVMIGATLLLWRTDKPGKPRELPKESQPF